MQEQNGLVQIDNDQIVKMIKEYQESSDASYKKKISSLIYVSSIPFIKNVVYSFARRATDPLEDLYQVASIGVLRAINHYDTSKGASFKTYAATIIVSEIRHYLRDKMSLVKVSRHTKELSYRITKIVDDLTNKYGRTPTNEEISIALDIPEEKVVEIMDIERRLTPISIDEINGENEYKEDYLSDKEAIKQYEDYILNKDYAIILNDALKGLDSESQKIIELSFFSGYSQAEIAKELNMSAMAVSRKTKKILNSLLDEIKAKGVNI